LASQNPTRVQSFCERQALNFCLCRGGISKCRQEVEVAAPSCRWPRIRPCRTSGRRCRRLSTRPCSEGCRLPCSRAGRSCSEADSEDGIDDGGGVAGSRRKTFWQISRTLFSFSFIERTPRSGLASPLTGSPKWLRIARTRALALDRLLFTS